MIRGGHVDVSILGAMEVSCNGDLVSRFVKPPCSLLTDASTGKLHDPGKARQG